METTGFTGEFTSFTMFTILRIGNPWRMSFVTGIMSIIIRIIEKIEAKIESRKNKNEDH